MPSETWWHGWRREGRDDSTVISAHFKAFPAGSASKLRDSSLRGEKSLVGPPAAGQRESDQICPRGQAQ